MAKVRTLARSFAGGEITPELYGRVDLTKFQTGLAECRNMMVLPHGPATCRPGFEYVLQTKVNTGVRLIPFSYNTEQTYIVEMGNFYMRFHTNGQTLLDNDSRTITSITDASPPVVTYTGTDPASDAWVYIDTATGTTDIAGRYLKVSNLNTGAKTFELQDLRGNNLPASGVGTGGSFEAVYELTSPYTTAQLFEVNYVQSADVLTLVHPGQAIRELQRLTANSFQISLVTFAPEVQVPTGITLAGGGPGGGTAITHDYVVTSISDTYEESVASANSSLARDLTVLGNYINISWTAPGTGPTPIQYNIYRRNGGGTYGFIGSSAGLSFRDFNITPDYSTAPPTNDTPISSASNYPQAVSYFEQRRLFGGTDNNPTGFWMTRSGTEANMSRSLPLRDDDSIRGTIISKEVNEIRHFIPLTDLLVLTSGGEWVIRSSDGGAITPASVSVRPQSYQGAAQVVPQVTGNSVLYLQAAEKRVHEIQYSDQVVAYTSNDISIMVPHLTNDYTIVDMAYARSPDQILWCVRSDGTLLGCTYVPEHEVTGWHQHTTEGSFKSSATVIESNNYALYTVVERTIDGSTVQYIERLHNRQFTALEDWFGVDAGLTYDGAAATTISGLWHLEGEEVEVLADGAVIPGMTVTDGAITLPDSASKVHIGLGYTPMVALLPLALEAEAAGYGRNKNVSRVYMRVNRSSGVQAGYTETDLRTYPERLAEPYDAPPALKSEELELSIEGVWGADGDVYVSRTGPLPLTLVSVSLEVEVGG